MNDKSVVEAQNKNELKCPFCQQELQEDIGYDGDYSCPNCTEPYFGSPELWQELIRTRKALDVAVDTLERIASEECKYPIGAAAGTIIRIEQINETKGGKDESR